MGRIQIPTFVFLSIENPFGKFGNSTHSSNHKYPLEGVKIPTQEETEKAEKILRGEE